MAKDAYWFRHDSTAGRGTRIRKLQHIYGHEGKGIYWDVVELLREQENYCSDADDSSLQMVADLIGYKDTVRFINWFKDCVKLELFTIQRNKFYCPVLCENMKFWEKQKTNGDKGGRPEKPKLNPTENPKPNPNETIIDITDKEDINKRFANFISWFNKRTGKKCEQIDKVKKSFRARIEKGYTPQQFETALNNMLSDNYHIETGLKYITPEFLLRQEKLDKFLNMSPTVVHQKTNGVTWDEMYPTISGK